MTNLWGRQPTLILALVNSAIALAVGFGAHITTMQFGLLMAFTSTLLGVLTNTQVTPMATLPDHIAASIITASNANVPKTDGTMVTAPPIAKPPTGSI